MQWIAPSDSAKDQATGTYLRLRGVNCPEMDTPGGRRTKAFTQKIFANAPHIFMTSTKNTRQGKVNTDTDNWDRYVADVWLPAYESDNSDSKRCPGVWVAALPNKSTVISNKERNLRQKGCIYLNQLLLDEGMAVRM